MQPEEHPRETWTDRGRHLVLGHVLLASAMVIWRVIEAMPRTASMAGSSFAASVTGRALALVAILGGIGAVVAIALLTFRLRRDPRAIVLFVALILALSRRKAVDVFDLTYVAFVAIAAALALTGGRRTRTV